MMAVPVPSSIAPVPWSQLSRCAPSITTSSGRFAPATSRDDVLRVRTAHVGGAGEQVHTHAPPERDQALDLVGVRGAERERRHRHVPVGVAPWCRYARCDDCLCPPSAAGRRWRRAAPPRAGRRPGRRPPPGSREPSCMRTMRCATMAILPLSEPGAAALSSVRVGKITTSPSSPPAGVGGDSPRAATDQRLGAGGDQRGALAAAHPGSDREGLDVRVLEAERFEARRRPGRGLLLVR